MSDFEFIFVLYALVLGLSLVELLAGFGRTLENEFESDADGTRFRFGWLTPLLGVFVLLDLLSFWMFAWTIQSLIKVSPAALLGVMIFAASYYLAARLVFPTRPELFEDLDTHYYRVRRTVMGILIALVFAQWVYLYSIETVRAAVFAPMTLGLTAMLVAMMAATMIVKNRHVQAVLLVALCIRYLVIYLI